MSDTPDDLPDPVPAPEEHLLPFRVAYTYDAREHLRALSAQERSLILDRVDEELVHTPHRPTRHRKPLRPNPVATWELRIGELRVFYDLDAAAGTVTVVAVGVKRRNRLMIGTEEVEL